MTSSETARVAIYTPDSPLRRPIPFLVGFVQDVFRGRELAWRLFTRDLNAQFRQTWLGYTWALLPPLAAATTFIFLQSQGIVEIAGLSMPYAAFAMIGTLLWQTFVDAVQSPLASITAARPMLAKVNFPREAVFMSGLCMVLFNFAIRLVLLAGVMAWWRIVPGPGFWMFPVAMLGLLACGFAIGLLLVPLGALYGDVNRALPIVTQFLMLLTPVVYPARDTGLAGALARLNPVAPLIVAARESLTGAALTTVPSCLGITAVAGVACLLGMLAFRLFVPLLIERMGS